MQLQLQNVILFILIKNLTQDTPVLFGKSKNTRKIQEQWAVVAINRNNDASLSFAGSFSLWAGWLLLFYTHLFVCLLACFLAFFQRHRLRRRRRRRRGAFRFVDGARSFIVGFVLLLFCVVWLIAFFTFGLSNSLLLCCFPTD
jgi:amino acid transporter